jgi:hypothetical protein
MGRPSVVYDKSKDDKATWQQVVGKDGNTYLIDTNADDPLATMKRLGVNGQYRDVVDPAERLAAGIKPEDKALYRRAPDNKLEPVGGGPLVSIDQKAEGKQAETLGAERGKSAADVEAAARNATGQISRLNLLGALLEKANTGKLGEAEATVVGWGRALGMSPDDLQRMGLNPSQAITKEAAQKIINELTVGAIGKGGFPANNFSDADRAFLEKIFPSIANQPEANGIALDVMRRVEQRKIEVADAWGDYQDRMEAAGKTPDFGKFEREYRRSLKGQPDMFADVAEKIGQLRSPKPEAGGAPAPRTETPPPAPPRLDVGGSTTVNGITIRRVK